MTRPDDTTAETSDGVFFPSVIRRTADEWKELFAALASDREPAERVRIPRTRITTPKGLRTSAEAAARLDCSLKTLRAHVAAGELRYVTIGQGTKRPRRRFTDQDLNEFIAAQSRKDSPPCHSIESRVRPTGISNFKSKVVAFTAVPKPPSGAKRKK